MRETGITTVTCDLCLNRSMSLHSAQLEKKFLEVWWTSWYQVGEVDICSVCAMTIYSAQKLGIIDSLTNKISICGAGKEKVSGRDKANK